MEQKFSSLEVMEAANHSKNSAMEAENHVKHGESSKSQMSRSDFLKACFALSLVPTAMMMGCGGSGRGSSSTPSGVCKIVLNALVKKDFKTAASFLYTYGTSYTEADNVKLLEEDFSYFEILKYEIQDEQISADGKNARVTAKVTIIENGNEIVLDKNFPFIKTESDGWKIEENGRTLF